MTHTQRSVGLVTIAVLAIGSIGLSARQEWGQGRSQTDMNMSGMYYLESTRGGDPRDAAYMATRWLPPGQRDRAYQNLLARLDPPQQLSIERDGRTITIASDRGPRSTFDADGRTQSERGMDGRMVTTRAEIAGNQIRVSTNTGMRGSDFSVTFESMNYGNTLRVTRRLDDEDLRQPVTFQSYYRRSAPAPRWDVYDDRGGNRDFEDRGRPGFGGRMYAVPDGTRINATLDTPLSMRTSRNGEPFTMTVRSPGDFQGARIDGVVSRMNSSRGNGQDMRIDFQRIELRGQSYEFDAMLNTVRLFDGTVLRINADGEVREANRGNDTVRNGAIGVAVGAIIGALAGGGKGAAIGAAIGGAGGVIVSQGHETLDIPRGAEVTLTAVSGYRTP